MGGEERGDLCGREGMRWDGTDVYVRDLDAAWEICFGRLDSDAIPVFQDRRNMITTLHYILQQHKHITKSSTQNHTFTLTLTLTPEDPPRIHPPSPQLSLIASDRHVR